MGQINRCIDFGVKAQSISNPCFLPYLAKVKFPTETYFSGAWSILRSTECGLQCLSTVGCCSFVRKQVFSLFSGTVTDVYLCKDFSRLKKSIILNKLFVKLEELVLILHTTSGYLRYYSFYCCFAYICIVLMFERCSLSVLKIVA